MRRLFVAAVACAAVLLPAAAAAAAPELQGPAGHTRAAAPAPHVSRKATPFSRSFAPLGARLAGSVTVSGTVYTPSHFALGSVPMEWWSWSSAEQRWYGDSMQSGVDGSYSVSPLATSSGEIWAYPDEDTTLGRTGQTWTAGNSYTTDIYPGSVTVSAARDGVWNTFGGLSVDLWGDQAYSWGYRETSGTASNPATVELTALDGTYTQGSVNFWVDEGVEFTDPITVSSGSVPSATVNVSESGAQRLEFPKTGFKYSGKPGATVRVNRINFPAGWRNDVTGYSDPSGKPSAKYGVKISQGGAIEGLNVKVPATAKPGYSYWIGFQHVNADGTYRPLYVETSYQVCTMKPTKASIRRGTRIKIKGIVPTEGHWGSKLGKRKLVWVLWHKGTAPVPTKADARKQGWVAVARVRTTATGAYTSAYLKPPRTGTFVVLYEGDNWYYSAYTSTARVTVR
jgi:hypothetical protein